MELLKDFWFFITHPSYYIMNDSYDKQFDRWFNDLLDNNTFKRCEYNDGISYTVELGGEIFWIENQPYACFTSCHCDFYPNRIVRPSRRTIYKAIKKLEREWKQ